MSRKTVVGALAAGLAVSGASIASAGDDDDRRVIRLAVKGSGLALVDNGQPGQNPGDRVVASGDLLRNGEKVGDAALDCTLVRVQQPEPLYSCVAGASLPGGQITFQAIDTAGPTDVSATAAVTGGTGRYRTAHGEATLTVAVPGQTGDVTIRLR